MNKATLIACLFIAAMTASLKAQDFTNLNFEDAMVTGSSGVFATGDALPGWSAFSRTDALSTIPYNGFAVLPSVGLYGPPFVLDGQFSIVLSAIQFGQEGSISQTGLIPSGTQTLLFDASSPSLLVSLGDQNLSYTAIASATNGGLSYNVYAANVSGFAGQMETLVFTSSGTDYALLDDIQFSPEAIPEPSTISLFFLGSGVLFYVRRKYRR